MRNNQAIQADHADHAIVAHTMEQTLGDLEAELGIHLTLHDHHGLLSTPAGTPLLPGRNYHGHPYCQWKRTEPATNRQCVAHCVHLCDSRAAQLRQPFQTHCWKGIREVVVPIFRDDDLALTLYAGGFRDENDTCPLIGRAARTHFNRLPLRDEARMARLARILHTLGQGLLQQAQKLATATQQVVTHAAGQKPLAEADQRRDGQIRQFVHHHAHRADLKLADLAAHLHLSPSRCSHVVRDVMGMNFQQMIVRERLKRSRTLLTATDWPLPRVAEAVGLPNAFHFNRLFRKHVGQSPGAYRRQMRQAGATPHDEPCASISR